MKAHTKNKEKEEFLLGDYRRPKEQQIDLVNYQRDMKKKEKEVRDDIRKE